MHRITSALLFAAVALLFASSAIGAESDQMEQCNKEAAPVNTILPMNIDVVTTGLAVECRLIEDRVTLIYHMEFIRNKALFTKDVLRRARDNNVNLWCNVPAQRVILEKNAVGYEYQARDGTPIGQYYFSKKDCDIPAASPDPGKPLESS